MTERKGVNKDKRVNGEEVGGVQGGKIVFRLYYIKKSTLIKEKCVKINIFSRKPLFSLMVHHSTFCCYVISKFIFNLFILEYE